MEKDDDEAALGDGLTGRRVLFRVRWSYEFAFIACADVNKKVHCYVNGISAVWSTNRAVYHNILQLYCLHTGSN